MVPVVENAPQAQLKPKPVAPPYQPDITGKQVRPPFQETTQKAPAAPKEPKPAKPKPFDNAPQGIYKAKVDPASINFEGEDPWLKDILDRMWATLPDNWDKNELANYPREALKAILFFMSPEAGAVIFRDQFMPGNLAAMQIVNDVRQDAQNVDNYNQQVKEWYARKAEYDKQLAKQQQQAPLPYRIQPGVI